MKATEIQTSRGIAAAGISQGQILRSVGTSGGMLQVNVGSAATDLLIGIALETVDSGEVVSFCTSGEVEAIAGGVLTPGTEHRLTSDGGGRCVAAAATEAQIGLLLGSVVGAGVSAASDRIRIIVALGTA